MKIMQVLPPQGLLASVRLCLNFETAAVTCEKWYEADRKYAGNIWRAARAPACLSYSHRWLGVQAALQHHNNMHVCLLTDRICISICWKPNRLHSHKWYSSGMQFFTLICQQKIVQDVLNTYCWIHSTYTIPSAFWKRIGFEVAHPGVDKTTDPLERRYHKYYQWVCFCLFFQVTIINS